MEYWNLPYRQQNFTPWLQPHLTDTMHFLDKPLRHGTNLNPLKPVLGHTRKIRTDLFDGMDVPLAKFVRSQMWQKKANNSTSSKQIF
jgi:hypothetical protein